MRTGFEYYTRHLDRDIPAGVVVFLVALPLCLGIAIASGAPPFSGVIAGVVGGTVVALISGSQLSVSGPAAGLTVIVASNIETLGLEGALVATAVAGLIQLAMGYAQAGIIGAYFPSTVIKGMLAAIGLLLIAKQLPYAVGFVADATSDLSFLERESGSDIALALAALKSVSPGATLLTLISIAILVGWEAIRKPRVLAFVPGPLLVVLFGVLFDWAAQSWFPLLGIPRQHLVTLPLIAHPMQFFQEIHIPDFGLLRDPRIYAAAGTLALVGSLETLLSLEAVDKLDPLKRIAPSNRELKAQGLGNFISGSIGGLPITAVIVRSSANIDAGGYTKVSAIVHGVLLLFSVMFLSRFLNAIPLACLAAVLLLTGYKLAKPKLFVSQFRKGVAQFAPFVVTIAAILATDLLKGMAIGMLVGFAFVLWANYHSAFKLTRNENNYLLRLQNNASFINKAPLRKLLASIEAGSSVVIDGTRAAFIDDDIAETLSDFVKSASESDIQVELKNVRIA